mgnify:CR=1 FL=1
MKPGDLVKSTSDWFLYEEHDGMFQSDIKFMTNEIGVILESKIYDVTTTWQKLLTPSGIGWAQDSWLRRVE